MIPALLPSQESIITRNIQSLESQLLDLEERFNVIVKWIQSQYLELRGLPDNVVTAIRGPSKNTDNINRNKFESQANKSTDDELDDVRSPNISCETEEDQNENKNPVVQLDKLTLTDVESLTELHSITNLKAIKTYLSKAVNSRDSSLLICDICQKRFKLRIHLKKHKTDYHWGEDNAPASRRRMSKPQTKKRRSKIRKFSTEENAYGEILQFPVISDEESDLGSLYDPLGDINKDDSESEEDHLKTRDEDNDNTEHFDVDSSCTIKDEVEDVEIKEEIIEDCSFSTIPQETEQLTKTLQLEDSDSTKLNCKICKRTFKYTANLKRHEGKQYCSYLTIPEEGKKSSKKNKKYKCDQCETFFANKRKCMRHVKTHSKSAPKMQENVVFKCDLCEKSFETQKICNTHLKICLGIWHPNVLEDEEVHLSNLNSSNKCLTGETFVEKYSFNSEENETVQEESSQSLENQFQKSTATAADSSKAIRAKLQSRKKSNEKEADEDSNFICNICAKPLANLNALKNHKRIHLRPEVLIQEEDYLHPNYRCLKCDQVFTAKSKFFSHVKSLCGTRQLKTFRKVKRKPILESQQDVETSLGENKGQSLICQVCGKTLSAKNSLLMHMRVHTEQRDFLCTECGKSFKSNYCLKMHQLAIHSDERKYKCQYCESTFKLKFVRNKHERAHLGVLKVNCDICGYTFSNKQSLKMHIKGVHENQRSYQCHLCEKYFKTSTARNYHVKTHDNPNGRKRGLNKDTDHMKAADKRNRWQKNKETNLVQE